MSSASRLAVEGLSHQVPDARGWKTTLAPLTHTFVPGITLVRGPSGAGKTTLLSLLSLLVPHRIGAIRWNGDPLGALDPRGAAAWRRAHVGIVFQTSRLISSLSAIDHLTLACAVRGQPLARAEAAAMLDRVGLGDRMARKPAQLSGGEKQRVALAQVLAAAPRLVLADEPTASLDDANAATVSRALARHARDHDAIVICVTHDDLPVTADVLQLHKPVEAEPV